jgi:hypothetical protein
MPEPDHTLDVLGTIAEVLQAAAHGEVLEVAEGAEGLRLAGSRAGSGVPENGPARRRKVKAAGGGRFNTPPA